MKRFILLWCVIFALSIIGSAMAYDTSSKYTVDQNAKRIAQLMIEDQLEDQKLAEEQANNQALLTNLAPAKTITHIAPKPDQGVILQGGDNFGSATAIGSIPYSNTGTTIGYIDDYDATCPWVAPGSPDVVYSYTPVSNEVIDITLCGNSDYDTKLYVMDAAMTVIACSDDICTSPSYPYGAYVSEVTGVNLTGGTTYYIVVDGYGGSAGNYTIDITGFTPCIVTCPIGGILEGEPVCGPEYVDMYNGGCNSTPNVFQTINDNDVICGTSGTFTYTGLNYRDTDWFTITTTNVGDLKWKAVAEFPLLIFIIDDGIGNCTDYSILGSASVAACDTALITLNVVAGTYYLWIGPSVFSGADCPLDYVAFCDWVSTGPPPCADVLIGNITLPYSYLNGTNCGFVNNWSTTCLGSYDGGEDIIFSFTLLAPETVTITMDPKGTTWSGIAIDDACPLDPVTCIAKVTGSSGLPRVIPNLSLAAGTYYIMVDTWPSPTCIPNFDLKIEPPPPPQPGDVCATAFNIPALPYSTTGTTVGFQHNYDAVCPFTGGTAPDVVYKYTPAANMVVDVTLCVNTAYDSKLYVYENTCGSGEIACSDDACSTPSYPSPYVSEVLGVAMTAGNTYYVVVDGYGTSSGTYTLDITENIPCIVECPIGGILEGEPVCGPEYVDMYNGGCNSTPTVFQTINNHDVICGISGTFLYTGLQYRDTDWFELVVPADGNLSWCGVAEFPLLMFIMNAGSGDCIDYTIVASGSAAACDTLCLSWAATAGTYWLWIGPSVFTGADCPLDYVAWADGPENPLPDITIGMIPDNPPIIVPLGGQFTYVGTLTNNTVGDLYTDVWIKITHLPSGNFLNWRNWLDVLVVAGMTQSYNIIQMVGTWPPLGEYTLSASCGDYPGVVMDETSFNFTVVAGSGPNTDWASKGWGEGNIIPTEFALNSSHPNPFNATTSITFELPLASNVSLEIYNLMGQKVATLVKGNKAAGYHTVTWDAANYSSGIYFYKLTAGENVFTKRMTLIK